MKITSQDSSLYALDKLASETWGVAVSKPGSGLDCRQASSVKKFNITASTPAGTSLYFAFNTGGSWFRLDTGGYASEFSPAVPDFHMLETSGNTLAQLQALTSIPAFAGKLVRVATGLSSSDIANSAPSARISVLAATSTQQTSFTEYSPAWDLGELAAISDVSFNSDSDSGGTVSVTGKITRDDGSESDWLTAEQLRGLQATSLQLRAVYSVIAPGTGHAKLNSASVLYMAGNCAHSGGTGKLYSVTQDWHKPLRSVRITIKHSPLEESGMKLHAALRASPSQHVKEQLGIAPSGRKTYQLDSTQGIRYDTFRLYVDGQELSSGFELNGEVGRVTLTAPEGSIITASYESGWDKEEWHEMTLHSRYSLPDYDVSEYRLDLPGNSFTVGAFMAETSQSSGTENHYPLGKAAGHAQTVRLPHYAVKVNSLQYQRGGVWTALEGGNWAIMDDARLLRFAAPGGCSVRVSYDWSGNPVRIWQASAVFSD